MVYLCQMMQNSGRKVWDIIKGDGDNPLVPLFLIPRPIFLIPSNIESNYLQE